MHSSSSHHWRGLIHGTLSIFGGELFGLLAGLGVVIFLTRRLGPEGYGIFTLLVAIVTWVEWSIATAFSRATIKFIGEAKDWIPVGITVVRINFLLGICGTLIFWLLAGVIATCVRQSELAGYLRLFALDIPLFALGQAYRSILVGTGRFWERALCSSAYSVGKLSLVIFLTGFLDLSINGAILALIGASLLELVIIHAFYIRPLLFQSSSFAIKTLFAGSWPLFLSALNMRFYNRLGILALQILGGGVAQVGLFGAVQKLSQVSTNVLGVSFSPVLISNLSNALRAGDFHLSKKMAQQAMRLIIVLTPFAGIVAGASPEIVSLVFGPKFLPAGPLLAVQIFGTMALLMLTVTTAILISANKPHWTFALTGSLLPLSALGYFLFVPRFGALGVSIVITISAVLIAAASILAVHRVWRIFPPAMTLCRSAFVGLLVSVLSFSWHAAGIFLVMKLAILGLAVLIAFWILGEFGAKEIRLLRSLTWLGQISKAANDIS